MYINTYTDMYINTYTDMYINTDMYIINFHNWTILVTSTPSSDKQNLSYSVV